MYNTTAVSSIICHSSTVYPKKYAHCFVVLCFVVVTQSFIMNSHEVFIHIHQGCFAGTGAIVRLPQCQWSKPDGYGKISQCITTTKHSKAKIVCIFLGIYCRSPLHWQCITICYQCNWSWLSDQRDYWRLVTNSAAICLHFCPCGHMYSTMHGWWITLATDYMGILLIVIYCSFYSSLINTSIVIYCYFYSSLIHTSHHFLAQICS